MARTKICPSCSGKGRVSEGVTCAYCGATGLVDDGLDQTRVLPRPLSGRLGSGRPGTPLPRSLRLAVLVLGAAAAWVTYGRFQPDESAKAYAVLAFFAVALVIWFLHAIVTQPLKIAVLLAVLYALDHYGNGGAALHNLTGLLN